MIFFFLRTRPEILLFELSRRFGSATTHNDSSYPYDHVKKEIKLYDVPIKGDRGFCKKFKWSGLLPGIYFSHEKNAIFAVTESGVR